MNLENNPLIYASIEDALRLQRAGFDKDCAHYAYYNYTDKAVCYFGYYTEIKRDYMGAPFVGQINLPTLGEIDLPECLCIIKRPDGMYHIRTDEDFPDIPNTSAIFMAYENEHEARIEAWLWAKQNNRS